MTKATATSTRDKMAHWASVIKCDIEHEMGLLAAELDSAFRADHASGISRRIDVIQADFLSNIQSLVSELTNREIETLPE